MLLLAGAATAARAATAPPPLPPIVIPPTQDHHAGKVIFAELVTPDLAAAQSFYGALLGWTFRDIPDGHPGYAEAMLDGAPVAGIVRRELAPAEHHQPAWLAFLSVRDVDAAARFAVEHGARQLFAPHDIPDRGREAVLADPQGAVFGILASTSGDPADVLADPGGWIWASLITSDPEQAVPFYQPMFDYEVYDLTSAPGPQHLLLTDDDYARASINTLPPDRPGAHPHWLQFIRVDSAAAVAAKAQSLGGRILVAPHPDRHGGMAAVVADPQGAPFGLMEWADTESKKVTP